MIAIKITDFSSYKPETCRNGGDYWFSETYTEVTPGRFRIKYGTSADFPYCPFCGTFTESCSCGENPDPWHYISASELDGLVAAAADDPDYLVEKTYE